MYYEYFDLFCIMNSEPVFSLWIATLFLYSELRSYWSIFQIMKSDHFPDDKQQLEAVVLIVLNSNPFLNYE